MLISILRDEIGVSGLALSWITSFLTGRTQNVRISSCYSDNQNVDCGVPQFFNIYVRSQPKAFLQCGYKSCSFADDSSERKKILYDLPIQYLKNTVLLPAWTMQRNVHKLKINTDKTEITLFHPKGS